jgi:drug/metabolite transporter (DMT)-like permease
MHLGSAGTMGALFSLACALTWAIAVVLLKHTVDHVHPFALNFFRVTFTFPLLVVTLLLAGYPLFPQVSRGDYLRLAASSILGIAVADTLFHQSLKLVGAGIIAIIDTLYAPMVVLFAFLLLQERVRWNAYVGLALISGALLLTSTLELPRNRSRVQLVEGIGVGLLAIVFLSLGIVIAKPALNRLPVLWAAAFRQGVAAAALFFVAVLSRRRREFLSAWRPSSAWKVMVPATLLGSYLALTLWIAGMKYTLASVAAILGQSSTLWILIFSVLLLHERFTLRKAVAAALAFAGVLLVTLG